MKKTLAQLKRDLVVGTPVTMIAHATIPNSDLIGVKRFVKSVDTTGIYLKKPEDMDTLKRGSFLAWPKASALDYQGNRFIILFANGEMDLDYVIG